MIEFNDFVLLIHQFNEAFGILLDWLSDTFMQVGLGVVIWTGYVRHWVSSASQCRLIEASVGRVSLFILHMSREGSAVH
jgi:hypothetical protein